MTQPGRGSNPGAREMPRRLAAELVGTAVLVAIVVGSGIAAQRLSPHDIGLQLLENSMATSLGLTFLILSLGPVSGAHFNPIVSLSDWMLGRLHRGSQLVRRAGLNLAEVGLYSTVQFIGAVAGAELANLMYQVPIDNLAETDRTGWPLLLGEVVATTGLVTLIFALVRSGLGMLAAPAVGAYIGAAYWFTSSTSFANPAVTIGRVFSDSFAGIAPASVPGFIAAQLLGGVVAVALVHWLYPSLGAPGDTSLDKVVVPHAPENDDINQNGRTT